MCEVFNCVMAHSILRIVVLSERKRLDQISQCRVRFS